MRPYLLFVSGITGIVGMSFVSDLSAIDRMFIFMASFLSYGFGQALTDCFQIDTDSISSPYRPLTKGFVSRSSFLIVSVLGLAFCVSVFTAYNSNNLILGLVAGIGLATYTYFKRKWWAGPFYNAWIVTVLFFMAYLSGNSVDVRLSINLLLAASVVFFSYANFVLSGYFKDISADKVTGYITLPVLFGRRPAAFVSDIFACLSLFSAIIILLNSNSLIFLSYLQIVLSLLIGISLSFFAQIKLHKVKNDEEAFRPIELVVHSYIIILSGITLTQKPSWFFLLLLFYTAFVLVLSLRPLKKQI